MTDKCLHTNTSQTLRQYDGPDLNQVHCMRCRAYLGTVDELRQARLAQNVKWHNVQRPGYFGRRRDAIHMRYDITYGTGNWRLVWIVRGHAVSTPTMPNPVFPVLTHTFEQACRLFYEESYFQYLKNRPDDVDFICEFVDCIDNSPLNVQSGLDYAAQEATSTHIQDIAVRNVLSRLGRTFTGKRTELLIIRGSDSQGFRFNPGNVPFDQPALITQPEIKPSWAQPGSVEAFWQSNKMLQVRTP